MPTKKTIKTIQPEIMNPSELEILGEQILDHPSIDQQMQLDAYHYDDDSVILPSALPEYDPYLDDSYSDPDATYPRIQILRGEGAQKPCWFIPQSQLDRAG